MAQNTLRPADVFTPAGLPLKDPNVYAAREEQEERLRRYVRRGQVPVVYGEYGVGKTTLVRRYFFEREPEGVILGYFPVDEKMTVSDFFARILEVLEYRVERQEVAGSETRAGGGFKVLVAHAEGDHSVHAQTVSELVITTPTDLRMLEIMNENQVVLVLDEMHKASQELRSDLANLIKAIKTQGFSFPRITLIGTTLDAERLVQPDPGIDRFVKELQVPPLSDDEARYIVEEGFRRLGMHVSDILIERVVRTAAGAPTIVQAVCLDMAESAIEDGRTKIELTDYERAIHRYLDEHGKRLASAYLKAIETFGPRRYRKQILHAMADSPSDYVTLEELRERTSENLGEEVPSTALSGPLRALKTGEYGKVLQDVDRYYGGDRVYNLTAFTDPMMKSFIRFMREVEEQGLLPVSGQ
jgi:MoxR-like ATPase